MAIEEVHLHELFRYRVEIFYSEEDEAFVANVPDLKYCSALGETPEEALREIKIAMIAWIETAKSKGVVLPEPSK